jgi:hypothetical protein
MRRALQQLRVIVPRLLKGSWLAQEILIIVMALFLPIPLMALGFGVPLGIFFFLSRAMKWEALFAAGFVLGFPGMMIGLVAGLAAPYFLLKRHAQKARTRAREIVMKLDLTTPAVCPSCGGRATIVALGPDEPCPCPWCESGLLPSGEMEVSINAAANALLANNHDLDHQVVGGLSREEPIRWRAMTPLPGYVIIGRESVIKGITNGIPVRAFTDIYEGNFVLRLEVPVDTAVDTEIWFVRPEVEAVMRSLTREWGYSLPETPVSSPLQGWLAYAEGVDSSAVPPVQEALTRLGSCDSLLIDPAGLSLWRKARGLANRFSLVHDHHATMAALAGALQSVAHTALHRQREQTQ